MTIICKVVHLCMSLIRQSDLHWSQSHYVSAWDVDHRTHRGMEAPIIKENR